MCLNSNLKFLPPCTKINWFKSDHVFSLHISVLILAYSISYIISLKFSFYFLQVYFIVINRSIFIWITFNLTSNLKNKSVNFFWSFNEISIFSNNSHLGWRVWKLHIILRADQPKTISAQWLWIIGINWLKDDFYRKSPEETLNYSLWSSCNLYLSCFWLKMKQ